MSQRIKEIKIEDLILWTENPRDPINPNSSNQDVSNKAWEDSHGKWQLKKLAKEMKTHYDLSELPTVVYHDKTPIVYDGNRRMILAMLKHGYVNLHDFDISILPDVPFKIPCNVCSEDTAVLNVFRKHGDSGSWTPLDRDIFIHNFLHEPKSTFLKLEESTHIISTNSHLNKVFVKDEIFTNDKLKELGFEFNQDNFESKHSLEESKTILEDISSKIAAKIISTRKNRGKVKDVLSLHTKEIITKNKNKSLQTLHLEAQEVKEQPKKKRSRRTTKQQLEIFNGVLYLRSGQVSDLYRDIVDLYNYYHEKKDVFSQYFPSLIRMSLRLICEAASSDMDLKLDNYLKSTFTEAKKKLSKDNKTTLSTQNVTETTIVQLLHIGAHNYKAANNLEQTLALSLIVGEILTISHGR
jgi:hypothetical protein